MSFLIMPRLCTNIYKIKTRKCMYGVLKDMRMAYINVLKLMGFIIGHCSRLSNWLDYYLFFSSNPDFFLILCCSAQMDTLYVQTARTECTTAAQPAALILEILGVWLWRKLQNHWNSPANTRV